MENGKEGKSKKNELRQFSREEGVTLADSVETLGVDLRTRVKSWKHPKKKERRKKCRLRFQLIKNNRAFQKNYMKLEQRKERKDREETERESDGREGGRERGLEEMEGCQHLCAHIGSVGFVYLQHLSCVPPS